MALKPDEKLVAKLAQLLRQNDLTELEYQVGNERIKVAVGGKNSAVRVGVDGVSSSASVVPTPIAPPKGDEVIVNSPMVGMAYLSATPGTEPYAKKGDSVRKGKTLLIIEAMKTMNPVAAPVAGVVEKVIVKNESPVEYGEPLIVLKPS